MKLVVGLGNPGRRYARTRHNLGWWVLDDLAVVLRLRGKGGRWRLVTAAGHDATLLKPRTYMNRSGRAVAKRVRKTGIAVEDLLVVLDDLSLPLGALRMRARGSAGGHRGLQSVIDWLQSEQFPRLRLGIEPAAPATGGRDFVLSAFEPHELPLVDRVVERAVLAVQCWLKEGVDAAMSRYNGRVDGGDVSAGTDCGGDPNAKDGDT